MYKKDWVKLFISNRIKLMYSKLQKILSFFAIDQSPKALIFVKGISIS